MIIYFFREVLGDRIECFGRDVMVLETFCMNWLSSFVLEFGSLAGYFGNMEVGLDIRGRGALVIRLNVYTIEG